MQNNKHIYFLFLIMVSQLTFAMIRDPESPTSIKCEIFNCNREFQYLDDLELHLKKIHSMDKSTLHMDLGEELVALLKAPALQKSYDISYDDSEDSTYRCRMKNCNKVYTNLYCLKRHFITHSDERPFVCDQCGKAFKFDYHLKGHANVHQDDYPYPCKICDRPFKRPSDLNKHVKEVHWDQQRFRKKKSTQQSLAQ